MSYLFTSESVSEGHPDKLCDRVSDTLVDLFIAKDAAARTAVETLATTNFMVLAGEVNSRVEVSLSEIEEAARGAVRDIGYEQEGFHWQNFVLENRLHRQSADIAQGVDNAGAGDQGIMFGYAKNDGKHCKEFMPLAIQLSHDILRRLAEALHKGEVPGILPDSKAQVTVEYDDKGNPTGIDNVVLSTQHSAEMTQEQVRDIAKRVVSEALPAWWTPRDERIFVNPTGRFVIGGPDGDTGLTGRKIIVDTYGGYAPHGGGAFSGKDATKVDRSAAYMMRYLAKNIVAAGLADECLIQISYAIGMADPLSFYINCNRTAKVDEKKLAEVVREAVDLTPKGIIRHLGLHKPIYAATAAYGHFGRPAGEDGTFSWERLDLAERLRGAF